MMKKVVDNIFFLRIIVSKYCNKMDKVSILKSS